MPIIEVTLASSPDRTPEVKRALITALTNAVVETGVAPKEAVRVILREVPPENFAAGDVTLAERRVAQAALVSASDASSGPRGERGAASDSQKGRNDG